MKNKKNSFSNFFYNILDYFFIILISLVVLIIVAWRLNILFNYNSKLEKTSNPPTEVKKSLKNSTNIETSQKKEEVDKEKKNIKDNNKNEAIVISIPAGSDSETIGIILEENSLISDAKEFSVKAEELGQTTNLKSGEFKIQPNLSLEEIIELLIK